MRSVYDLLHITTILIPNLRSYIDWHQCLSIIILKRTGVCLTALTLINAKQQFKYSCETIASNLRLGEWFDCSSANVKGRNNGKEGTVSSPRKWIDKNTYRAGAKFFLSSSFGVREVRSPCRLSTSSCIC